MVSSPFGKYATAVAAAAAFLIIGAWLASLVGVVGHNPVLDSVALVVIGAIFGTGAGASVVANGAARQGEAANTRLDAIRAPSAPMAERIVADSTTQPEG